MNWTLLIQIAIPILCVVIGAVVTHVLERRPKLVVHFGHVSSFRIRGAEEGESSFVNAHSLILRNVGRSSATSVQIIHNIMPEHYDVFPASEYQVIDLPDGGKTIAFDKLVSGDQVTVSYLYNPPVKAQDIHGRVICDQGLAKVIRVLLTRQYPAWVRRVLGGLVIAGIVFVLYLVIISVQAIV